MKKLKFILAIGAIVVFLGSCARVETDGSTHTNATRVPKKEVTYSSLEEYRQALNGVDRVEYLISICRDTVNEKDVTMILEDQFFLLPQLRDGVRCDAVTFSANGNTRFQFTVHEKCRLEMAVFHHKGDGKTYDYGDAVQKSEFLTESGMSVTRLVFTEDAVRRVYLAQTENGYPITALAETRCGIEDFCMEEYIKNLTFEKVEIK